MPTPPTVIFPARRVLTMDPANPEGSALAVRDGRVLGVGSVDELAGWGEHTIDDRLAGKVLLPGFVEAHSHVFDGWMWNFTYVGYFERRSPDGRRWAGCTSIGEVIERLSEQERRLPDPDEPLIAWGLDPIYFPGERMSADHLDRVSTTRPVFVLHANAHLATVNRALMAAEAITADLATPGIARDGAGAPNGELQEPAAMMLAGAAWRRLMGGGQHPDTLRAFGRVAVNAGVTTYTDLGNPMLATDHVASMWSEVVNDPDYPARAVPFLGRMGVAGLAAAEMAEAALALRRRSTEKLFLGHAKLVLDGSIQGWTAQLSWPGYYTGESHAQFLIPPEQVFEYVAALHKAGILIHAHCNGDLTTELFVDAVEAALHSAPRWDHRHTVTHSQLTTPAQYRRMRALGMCANIFSNHVFYWGDRHRDVTVGPMRARAMNATATAKRLGVPFTLHSDAPVTPLGGLHLVWAAANRLTASGQVLGEHERISVADALEAITLGGAYVLKLDHLIGSLECGKLADVVALDDDPLAVDAQAVRDVHVHATMVGGDVHEARSG